MQKVFSVCANSLASKYVIETWSIDLLIEINFRDPPSCPPVCYSVWPKSNGCIFKREATSIDYFGRPTWHLARIFFHIAFGRENENKCLFFLDTFGKEWQNIFLAEVRRQKVTLSLWFENLSLDQKNMEKIDI